MQHTINIKTEIQKITSQKVTVMDADMKTIVIHKRLYGEEHERMDWLPYLSYIARRPRSLRNSGIYGMMPETMKDYLDNCENCDRGRVLKILAELTERTGFDSAVHTIDEAIKYNATDPDNLRNLYNDFLTRIVPYRIQIDNIAALRVMPDIIQIIVGKTKCLPVSIGYRSRASAERPALHVKS